MIRLALTLAGGTLFSVTAFAQSTVPTAEFVKKVAISDILEIQSSELVASNADEDTKPFAEKMIKDHSELRRS
jgi:putative membrane protein